jgi:hypothetical protein
MSKRFICDNCKKEFLQPLDEEMYKDIHGVWHTFDLCAPCRGELKGKKDKTNKDYFDKLIKK